MVKYTWEISSKEDGGERIHEREGSIDKNWKLTRRGGVSQLREKSIADSSKFLDCGANHGSGHRRSRYVGKTGTL